MSSSELMTIDETNRDVVFAAFSAVNSATKSLAHMALGNSIEQPMTIQKINEQIVAWQGPRPVWIPPRTYTLNTLKGTPAGQNTIAISGQRPKIAELTSPLGVEHAFPAAVSLFDIADRFDMDVTKLAGDTLTTTESRFASPINIARSVFTALGAERPGASIYIDQYTEITGHSRDAIARRLRYLQRTGMLEPSNDRAPKRNIYKTYRLPDDFDVTSDFEKTILDLASNNGGVIYPTDLAKNMGLNPKYHAPRLNQLLESLVRVGRLVKASDDEFRNLAWIITDRGADLSRAMRVTYDDTASPSKWHTSQALARVKKLSDNPAQVIRFLERSMRRSPGAPGVRKPMKTKIKDITALLEGGNAYTTGEIATKVGLSRTNALRTLRMIEDTGTITTGHSHRSLSWRNSQLS